MVPFKVRERDQQIWLSGVDAPPFERGEMLTYYLNMDMSKLEKLRMELGRASFELLINYQNLGNYGKHLEKAFRKQQQLLSFLKKQPLPV